MASNKVPGSVATPDPAERTGEMTTKPLGIEDITQGLASESAERVLIALETMARVFPRKMATYRFTGGYDTLIVVHRDHVTWDQQDADAKTGDYAYRMQWHGPNGPVASPSEGLQGGRTCAGRMIEVSKDRLVRNEMFPDRAEIVAERDAAMYSWRCEDCGQGLDRRESCHRCHSASVTEVE